MSTGARRREDAAPSHPAPVWFLGGEVYRRPAFGRNHPLAIPRVALVADLCRVLGWLPAARFVDSPRASVTQLARHHERDYIAAVQRASASGTVDPETRARHGLGSFENPVFPGLFERATTACGGSIEAARRVRDGGVAFNPAGGTHHGLRDRAHGFCYFNDPVLAIHALLDAGLARVMYVDLDAHHCDGVQLAFAGDARVLLASIHEQGRWPRTGLLGDRGGGNARNMPVPPGFNDDELAFLVHEALLPLGERFAPEALVVTVGADALAGDPLSRLALGNRALWDAVTALRALAPRLVVLGGGGYNPWTLARCWSGLWGVLCGEALPARLPAPTRALLDGLECELVDEDRRDPLWLETLVDPPRGGPLREGVRALPAAVLA